jgi:hypothetical protein
MASLALSIGLIAFLNRAEESTVTKLAAGIDNYSDAAPYRFTRNPSDKRCRRSCRLPDADHPRFTRDTRRTYVDVVATGGQIEAGTIAQCDVQ